MRRSHGRSAAPIQGELLPLEHSQHVPPPPSPPRVLAALEVLERAQQYHGNLMSSSSRLTEAESWRQPWPAAPRPHEHTSPALRRSRSRSFDSSDADDDAPSAPAAWRDRTRRRIRRAHAPQQSQPQPHPPRKRRVPRAERPAPSRRLTEAETAQRSARALQRLWRARAERRRQADAAEAAHREAHGVAEALISELLADEVIPDLLMGALLHRGDELDPRSPRDAGARDALVAIEKDACAALSAEVARQAIGDATEEYLAQRRRLIVPRLRDELVAEVVSELLPKLVAEFISHTVDEYMMAQRCERIFDAQVLDTLLPDEIAEVVAGALFEHESAEAARALLDECVHDIAAQLVLATVPDVSKKVSEEHVTHDRDAVVACAAHVVMGGSCLRQLAHVLGDRASSAMLTSQLKDLARRQAAARLLATAHEAARPREELQETLPLGRLQRALTLRAGLGSLLRLLRGDGSVSGGALDAEEQAIDERECVLIMERARRRERAALR